MILCAGEALIDMLPRQTAEGGQAFEPHAGGAVFNTAIAAGRLGSKVGFCCGLSTDLFGELLANALEASHVDARFSPRSNRPTTLAFVTLTDGHASYAFYDENTAGRMLSPTDLPSLDDEVKAVFVGGISLVVEPCASAFEALARREAGKRVVMIDPNIRPGFITDESAYRSRIERMLGLADIVKMSDEDMAWLLGDAPLDDNARAILNMGPRILFATEGAKGATAYTTDQKVFAASEKVDVIDTVGAGDTFNAGVLVALEGAGLLDRGKLGSISQAQLVEAMSLGAKAAGVTVSRAGANPPWRHEL